MQIGYYDTTGWTACAEAGAIDWAWMHDTTPDTGRVYRLRDNGREVWLDARAARRLAFNLAWKRG